MTSAEDAANARSGDAPLATAEPITIAVLAMGGEGGGVLTDWLVALAERNAHLAQATSVPGVAQRTGATLYYVELFPERAVPPGARPVLALAPVPGTLDLVVASELMEAGRALQRGLVSAERTTLVASTHRVYSMTERIAMGDGRVDADTFVRGARAAARRFVAADFGRIAQDCASLVSPVLFGAVAASGALPFARERFEDAIRSVGVGVEASLKAFAAGFDAALRAGDIDAAPAAATPVAEGAAPVPPPGPRLAAAAARVRGEFVPQAWATLHAGIARLADYQDVDYALAYLDRLAPLRRAGPELQDEAARHLALWMSYEDAVRVADLKTRASRFARVRDEVRLQPGQLLGVAEFMHPRVQEIADILPAALARWLLGTRWARGLLERATRRGRVLRTHTLSGFLALYAVAALRPLRRRSLRFAVEQQRIDAWLARVVQLAGEAPELALEVVRTQRLVKGYGDTHAHGWRNQQRLMDVLPRLRDTGDAAQALRALSQAALADDDGRALEQALARWAPPAAPAPAPQ